MPNLCGVNEKMLSEALKTVDEVKKNRKLVSTIMLYCAIIVSLFAMDTLSLLLPNEG